MATSVFRLYEDPENAGSAHSHKIKTSGSEKSFVAGKQAWSTPRKALVDVNRGPASLQQSQEEFKKPVIPVRQSIINKSIVNKSHDNLDDLKESHVKNTTVTNDAPTCQYVNDEIEYCSRIDNEQDDYEDIWPKSERISTYLSKLISWRPTCLTNELVSDGDSDSDDEFLNRLANDLKQTDKMSPQDEPIICEPLPIPDFDLSMIPFDYHDSPDFLHSLDISHDISLDQSHSFNTSIDQSERNKSHNTSTGQS